MTRILRLLLIAAIALPMWQPIAAQEAVEMQTDENLVQIINIDDMQYFANHQSFDEEPCDLPIIANQAAKGTNVSNPRARKAPLAVKSEGKYKAPATGRGISLKAPPSAATVEEWQISTDWYDNAAYTSSSETGWVLGSFGFRTVNVAIYNGTVYIQGLSKFVRDGWIEGTINGSTVTFTTGQEYGTDEDGNLHYFVGELNQEISNITFSYDSANGILRLTEYNYINESAAKTGDDALNGYGYQEGTVLMKIKDRPMKTLSEEEILALEDVDGEDYLHYEYTVNGETKTGSLLDVVQVTDEASAEHAIALLRAVYTNKYLPGPNFRGFDANGNEETDYPVSYAAVGTLSGTATRSGNTYSLSNLKWNDTYGWGINATDEDNNQRIITKSHTYNNGYYTTYTLDYAYFDPEQYRPYTEGYTLLLVEMQDNFDVSTITTSSGGFVTLNSDPHKNLVQYVLKTIKSVRILTEAKRTGTNVNQGTLFKIDANKINRFFLIGKGQCRLYKNSYNTIEDDFCYEPYFGANSSRSYAYRDGSTDLLFYHMFEQFSPSLASSGSAKTDIYKTLVTGLDATGTNKTGFPVYHDCSTVPYAEKQNGKGHEFKMLGDSDPVTNAPDVRDLLIFVPDHRLTYHSNTTFPDGTTHSRENNARQRFIYYNQDYAPRMDMYVIHLNEINGEQVEIDGVKQHVYELELNWKSNMNSFLPAEEQEFTLWRSISTADTSNDFEPVYRVNKMGQYVDANGVVLEDQNNVNARVPVTMKGIYSLNNLDYFDYIPMDPIGKQVTYMVRGQDAADENGKHFLSLQYSNPESYLIPGYDKNVRMTLKVNSDNYSRFDLPSEKNYYWNEIAVANNKGTSVTANFLEEGTVIQFKRWKNTTAVPNSTLVAEATIESKNVATGTITATMRYYGQETFTGSRIADNKVQFTFTFPAGEQEGLIEFGDFTFYDNFSVDVSSNLHPNYYYYRAYFEAAEEFELDPDANGVVNKSKDVYSNFRGFKIYKTYPSANAVTLDNVLNDKAMSVEIPDDSKYTITAERSPISQLWRYEICRWKVADNVPETFTYFGDVQNHGEEPYSSTFGLNNYTYHDNFPVEQNMNSTEIELEDRELAANGGAYFYVPQAVVYTKRTDNNTFGSERVSSAVGKMTLEIVPPSNEYPLMTTGRFRKDGAWYAYYNIYLKFTNNGLNIPDGYELYKVRAWRKVEGGKNVLGEEWPTRADRVVDGWYLYEDINFGDMFDLEDPNFKMNLENLSSNNAPVIGERSTSIAKPQDPGATGDPDPYFEDPKDDEVRATFGAKRLPAYDGDPDAAITELKAQFKVRAYFTRTGVGNTLVGDEPITTTNAPRIKADPLPGSEFDYYIAEGEVSFNSSDYTIITGIETLNTNEVVGVKYYNVAGIESDTPFQGVNIVVTSYSDGSTTTTKIIK